MRLGVQTRLSSGVRPLLDCGGQPYSPRRMSPSLVRHTAFHRKPRRNRTLDRAQWGELYKTVIGLDREILDRRPERPDELPTMLNAGRPQEPDSTEGGSPPSRPLLASDDVS